MPEKVSIQGYEGSFHQLAALEYLGKDTQVICCATFREVVAYAADKTKSNGGFMAIENSIAGSILPNYGLLLRSGLVVTGEIYLHIRQHLMAMPGITLEEIREVHSHPMALLQCGDYLEQFPQWKLVEKEDTALSAQMIRRHHHKHAAAIAGSLAADLFQLDLLAPDIQSDPENYTRFLFVQPAGSVIQQEGNKASIHFQTDHSRGSLVKVLEPIAKLGVNLSKLQSVPIPGREWRYGFHADLEFDNGDQLEEVLQVIRPHTRQLDILGIYQKGKTISR